jgi:hypothetical protein
MTHIYLLGLIWTSDMPVAGASIWKYTTLTETNIHDTGGIRPRKRAAAETRLHDHPFYLVCPNLLSPVGDPLWVNWVWFSESNIDLVILFLLVVLFTQFILDTK